MRISHPTREEHCRNCDLCERMNFPLTLTSLVAVAAVLFGFKVVAKAPANSRVA